MKLLGKGYYLWQLPYCDKGDAAAIASRAKAANLSHVMIKIADGPTWPYNFDFDRNIDLIPPVQNALREAGISVWGWHYVRGDDPYNEAQIAIKRTLELGMEGYVIDAEGEYHTKSKRGAATRFMQELRKGLPDLPIALSSYRFPRSHAGFPFDEFMAYCDISMPQVYFEQMHNPEEQLERTIEQYMALPHVRPVIPTAPTYARGDWRPSPDEIHRFFQKAQDLELTAANAWSWDFATRSQYLDLWDAVADHSWPVEPLVADMPERLLGRINEGDPGLVSGLYKENAAHVTGERTIVGRAAIQEWYRTLLSQILPNGKFEVTGKSGSGRSRQFMWRAISNTGKVLDGNDTLGLIDGRIQYHYTYFTVSPN